MNINWLKRFVCCLLCVSALLFVIPTQITAEDTLEKEIQRIVAGIPSSIKTDAMKALYLHDYVVEHVVYEPGPNDQTAYGALIEGKAVCAGYTDAYHRLLSAVGIESTVLSGMADPGSGNLQPHAWIMVMLNGKCYFTDVTWDDPFVNGVQELRHNYFNLSLEEMAIDHFPDDSFASILPSSCNHTDLDYYCLCSGAGTGVGIFDDDTTAEQAAKCFAFVSTGRYTCDFRFDGTDMEQWVSDNWGSIANALGLGGCIGCSISMSANTCVLTIYDANAPVETTEPATEEETELTEKPTETTKETEKPVETTKPTEKEEEPTQKPTEATEATKSTKPAETEPEKNTVPEATTAPPTEEEPSNTTVPPVTQTPTAQTQQTEEETAVQTETAGESTATSTESTQAQTEASTEPSQTDNLSITTEHVQTGTDVAEDGRGGAIGIAAISVLVIAAGGILGWGWYKRKKK